MKRPVYRSQPYLFNSSYMFRPKLATIHAENFRILIVGIRFFTIIFHRLKHVISIDKVSLTMVN